MIIPLPFSEGFFKWFRVGTMIHYTSPLHTGPLCKKYLGSSDKCPEADRISKEALSLPIYPEMEDSEVDYICQQLTQFDW